MPTWHTACIHFVPYRIPTSGNAVGKTSQDHPEDHLNETAKLLIAVAIAPCEPSRLMAATINARPNRMPRHCGRRQFNQSANADARQHTTAAPIEHIGKPSEFINRQWPDHTNGRRLIA